jgi:hypothetical protein
MHFPRYWARGELGSMSCWRSSDISHADAERQALAAVTKMDEVFRSGDRPQNRYGYPNAALREPVLKEISNDSGAPSAAITRNGYGCEVLNTARVMFVDVDFPEPAAPTLGGLIGKWFGGKTAAPASTITEAHVVSKAEDWSRQHEGWGWRVYRTLGGIRLMATHAVFEPGDAMTAQVFDFFGADPLYRRLCKTQKSFRARLTPKSWRCGLKAPDVRWPWEDPEREARFNQWDQKYQSVSSRYATCRLITATGSREAHPEVIPLIRLHDETTRVDSGLQLA